MTIQTDIFGILRMLGYLENIMEYDEAGNLYIYDDAITLSKIRAASGEDMGRLGREILILVRDYAVHCPDFYFLEKSRVDFFAGLKLSIDEEVIMWHSYTRRPYYRMRGRRVTEEQAFEIIRRTDFYMFDYNHKDYIGGMNFNNWLIDKNHYPRGYGWIHTNGVIGTNAITQKYPNIGELVAESVRLALEFPYLELVVGITFWNEEPTNWWNLDLQMQEYKHIRYSNYTNEFLEAVEIGVEIADGGVRILNKENTVELYKKYAKMYEEKNTAIYVPEYYQDNKLVQVDEGYLACLLEKSQKNN